MSRDFAFRVHQLATRLRLSFEQLADLDQQFVEAVDERDADPQPRQGDVGPWNRRLVLVQLGGRCLVGHRIASSTASTPSAESLGSCHFSLTGLISSLHTNPTTSSAIMIENDSV